MISTRVLSKNTLLNLLYNISSVVVNLYFLRLFVRLPFLQQQQQLLCEISIKDYTREFKEVFPIYIYDATGNPTNENIILYKFFYYHNIISIFFSLSLSFLPFYHHSIKRKETKHNIKAVRKWREIFEDIPNWLQIGIIHFFTSHRAFFSLFLYSLFICWMLTSALPWK